jgi:hypothetical protein
MRKNHSISLTNPKTCAISAALAHLSRACRSRFGPLLFWLAALLIIVSPVPAESQTNPQQKLVGTGAVGPAEQGWSVALSADGNTAIVGGVADNAAAGAAWVYTAAAASGPNRAASSSAPARWEALAKPSPSRCPTTVTPQS